MKCPELPITSPELSTYRYRGLINPQRKVLQCNAQNVRKCVEICLSLEAHNTSVHNFVAIQLQSNTAQPTRACAVCMDDAKRWELQTPESCEITIIA